MMNAKKEAQFTADRLAVNLAYLRTLLQASEDKVAYYLSNKSVLGPNWELLSLYAAELGNLLALSKRIMETMDEDMDRLTDMIYQTDQLCRAQ